MNRAKIRDLILCALFAAIIAVFSVMTIPIGPVPVSMSVFAIMLAGLLLGWKRAVIAVSVYILIGAAGMPVFSGFRGGLSVLIGPTGGFIISYIPMSALIGIISNLGSNTNKYIYAIKGFAASIAGLILCYIIGTFHFSIVMSMSFRAGLAVCVYPFIVFDLIKAAAAVITTMSVRRALPAYFNMSNPKNQSSSR